MKKTICMGVIVLMALFFAVPAYAAVEAQSVNAQEMGTLSPQYTYISRLVSGLSIDSFGKSTSIGDVSIYEGSNTVVLTVQLQKFNGSSWNTIKTWSDSGAGLAGVYITQDYYVVSGTYRVCATAQVYNSSGQLLETQSAYSPTKTY